MCKPVPSAEKFVKVEQNSREVQYIYAQTAQESYHRDFEYSIKEGVDCSPTFCPSMEPAYLRLCDREASFVVVSGAG